MRLLWALCLIALCAGPVSAQTVQGITLGAPIPEGLPPSDDTQTQAPFTRTFWSALNGLQVTAIADSETGGVHFIELRPATREGGETPIEGIRFGETTQADLHRRFGSEGIVFANVGRAGVFGDVAAYFTSYELTDVDVVVSFTTIEPLAEAGADSAAQSVLDSVVVAEGPYLNQVWGINRGRLPGYGRIEDPFAN
ncbi:hypothetical protein [Gymnodinialimonas sp.]